MKQDLKNKVDKWFSRNWKHYLNEVRTNITKGKMSGYTDDICAFMYTEFLKQSPDRIEQMLDDDKILNWLLRGTSLQIRSQTSPFYSQYRKKRANMVPSYYGETGDSYSLDDETLDDMLECVLSAIEEQKIDWYYAKLLELKYLQGLTYKEIRDRFGIQQLSFSSHLDQAIDAVREVCKEYDN